MPNRKITELTALTDPDANDLLAIVDDPSGSPVTKQISATKLVKSINNQAATFVVAASDSIHKERADYICDGVDDQIEIQEALDSMTMGGVLFLLDGIYWLSSTINMPDVSGITIEGSGLGTAGKGSLLYLADGANCSMFTCDHATHVYFTSFKNFGMNGRKVHQGATSHGFNVVKDLSDGMLEDMIIMGFHDDGFHAAPSTHFWNFWLNRILLESCGGAGIYLDATTGGVKLGHVIDCYFYGNEYGIQAIKLKNGLIISNSYVNSNKKHGIYFQGVTKAIISSSEICDNSGETSNTFDGIYLEDSGATPSSYNQIIGCDLSDKSITPAQRYGINLQGNSDYILIPNNIFHNNYSGSINIGASVGSHNIIKDNIGYINQNFGTSTGTGAQQTIAHGLAKTPTKVILWNIEDGANPYQSAAADGTNIKITAVINQDYGWEAEVV